MTTYTRDEVRKIVEKPTSGWTRRAGLTGAIRVLAIQLGETMDRNAELERFIGSEAFKALKGGKNV